LHNSRARSFCFFVVALFFFKPRNPQVSQRRTASKPGPATFLFVPPGWLPLPAFHLAQALCSLKRCRLRTFPMGASFTSPWALIALLLITLRFTFSQTPAFPIFSTNITLALLHRSFLGTTLRTFFSRSPVQFPSLIIAQSC